MEKFDFVIVGGGSAASVLAYRLSEGDRKTVCVLEAGPRDTNPYIRIPAGFIKTILDPTVTWQFATEPTHWTGGRRISLTQGKVWGGSSSVNGAIYNRGQARDFDTWAQLGNPGWGYADVLPYFRRTERRVGDGDDRYRGRAGELPITTYHWPNPLCDAFVEAAVEMGIPRNLDYNGARQEGVGFYQSAILNSKRVSASHAFLHPAAKRKSVSVRSRTLATKILLRDRRAVGVIYQQGGTDKVATVEAREAVILSAGTLNTPKLLQLSGIGPAELLRQNGIEVQLELPGVGENLRDHYNARIVARGRPGTVTFNDRVTGPALVLEVMKWLTRRPSVLGLSPALVHIFGKTDARLDNPDFCLGFTPGSYKLGFLGKLDDFPGMTCGGWRMRPDSTGYVRIASPDPMNAPTIQPNYLNTEQDRAVLVATLKIARRLFRATTLEPFVEEETFPGPAVSTDDEWLDFARTYGGSSFHLVGTAKMGPKHDRLAVVDERLRVRGVEALVVADASVMPTLVSANTYAATLMIAEKASDMMLGRAPLSAAIASKMAVSST
jgi:choline dehydrogenase